MSYTTRNKTVTPVRSAPLAVTSGEPAGIGPDICLQLGNLVSDRPLLILGDRQMLRERADQLGLDLQLQDYGSQPLSPGHLSVLHIPLEHPVRVGQLDPANSHYVLELLRRAVTGCQNAEFSGLVTAPVHKGVINDAGIPFTGHTEFLAELAGISRVVMMLVGGNMRVALATTHLALRDVPDAITGELLEEVLCILHQDLRQRFGLASPRIMVAGLNPHAGEDGHLGREEIDIMSPVLDTLRSKGFDLSAPLPADTLFTPQRLSQCDCVLAMYHDQGLPVLKHASFGRGVNVTLGLPFIRTSVDHGTALELAGSGRADAGSLLQAIEMASQMLHSVA